MILLPEGLEGLWHLSRLPDLEDRSHPEDLWHLSRRPDLEGRSHPEDPEDLLRLSLRSDL